jgi:hypothetical protein
MSRVPAVADEGETLRKLESRYSETALDDEIVIMRLDNGELFSLTGTGAAVWRLIDGRRDRKALLTTLSTQYDTGRDQLAAEVDDFLARLRAMGLIAGG